MWRMARTRMLGMLLAIAGLAGAAPARADEGSPRKVSARVEAGPSLGVGSVAFPLVSWRGTAVLGHLIGEGSVDVSPYAGGSPRDFEATLLLGAGVSFPLGPRWDAFALAVGGMHALDTSEADGIGYQQHALPALGARIGATASRPLPNPSWFLSLTVAATAVADLRREYDYFLREDVGGITAFLTVTVGLGVRR